MESSAMGNLAPLIFSIYFCSSLAAFRAFLAGELEVTIVAVGLPFFTRTSSEPTPELIPLREGSVKPTAGNNKQRSRENILNLCIGIFFQVLVRMDSN